MIYSLRWSWWLIRWEGRWSSFLLTNRLVVKLLTFSHFSQLTLPFMILINLYGILFCNILLLFFIFIIKTWTIQWRPPYIWEVTFLVVDISELIDFPFWNEVLRCHTWPVILSDIWKKLCTRVSFINKS